MSIEFYVDTENPQTSEEGTFYLFEPDFMSTGFSNANARLMLKILDLPEEDCGSVSAEELPKIRRRIFQVLSSFDGLLRYVREPSIEKGTHGATVYHSGYSHADIEDGLNRILRVVREAQKRNTGIYWA